jgi:hypothetical protein
MVVIMNNQSPYSTKRYQGIQPPTVTEYSKGMTLRDYMAAAAMQGMMVEISDPACDYIAQTAYKMADAMLKARKS